VKSVREVFFASPTARGVTSRTAGKDNDAGLLRDTSLAETRHTSDAGADG